MSLAALKATLDALVKAIDESALPAADKKKLLDKLKAASAETGLQAMFLELRTAIDRLETAKSGDEALKALLAKWLAEALEAEWFLVLIWCKGSLKQEGKAKKKWTGNTMDWDDAAPGISVHVPTAEGSSHISGALKDTGKGPKADARETIDKLKKRLNKCDPPTAGDAGTLKRLFGRPKL